MDYERESLKERNDFEDDEEEYQRAREARRRRRLEARRREEQKRKLIRIILTAVLLVFAISVLGKGIGKLTSKKGGGKENQIAEDVLANADTKDAEKKDSDKDLKKDADKDADKDVDKDTDKDADKDTNKDADKDTDKDVDKDADKDKDTDKDKVKDKAEKPKTTKENKTKEVKAQKQPVMRAEDLAKMTGDVKAAGWQKDSTGKWYRDLDGTFYQNGWREIDGQKYYFGEDGYAVTGWLDLEGKDYFFDKEGRYDDSKIRPMVALTYDDGPGKYTEELLECLNANNAKATFYMLGENAKNYPEIVKKLEESGMGIGNHTYDHQILTKISKNKIKNEIGRANQAIEKAAGVAPTSLRPPGGSYNEDVQKVAGLPIVKWSLDTKDWKTRSEEKTYQVTMDNVVDGSIVLMHDIHESSVKASLKLIPDLIEKGFKLVTIDELAKAKGFDMEDGEEYSYMGEGEQMVE